MFYLGENYLTRFFVALKDGFFEAFKIGDIGEQIREAIAYHEVFKIGTGRTDISFGETIVGEWVAVLVILITVIYLGRGFKKVPDRKQVVTEGVVGIFVRLCKEKGLNNEQTKKVAPFVGSIAFYICFTNLTSVFRLTPPAKDPVFAVTLAIFTIIYVLFTGIRLIGFKGFFTSLAFPIPALIPFKILDYFIKPISLSLRLFGNVFGAFIFMDFIFIVIPAVIPGILGIWFDIVDGILQAAIFSYLSIVYIGEIVSGAEHAKEYKKIREKQKPIKTGA